MLNEDYRDMLRALSDEKVRFILVGAYALAAHGYPRATMDIDIWVMPSPENADAVLRALRRFGVPLHNLSKEAERKRPDIRGLTAMLEGGVSLPGPPGRTYFRHGEKYTMDLDQYDAYLTRSSALARPRLERMMTSLAWPGRPEEWQADRIKAIVAHARKRARSEMKRRIRAEGPREKAAE